MARNSECPHCGVVNYCRQQPWCPRRLAQMQCDDHEMAAASALRDNRLVDRLRIEVEELRQLLAYVINDDYDCGDYYHNFCGCITRLQDETEQRLNLISPSEEE